MTFDVTSVGDTTPPVLSALALSPAAVDVASALDVVVVTTTITDDLSGVAASTLCGWAYHGSPSQIRFQSPSGGQIQDGIAESLGGDTYALRVTIPQYEEQGTWTVAYNVAWWIVSAIPVTLYPADLAAGGYPMTFDVTSVGDTTPPVLSALVLSPAAVDVASALDVVVVTATITDDLSGVAASTLCGGAYHSSPSQIRFQSPSGGQIQDGIAESLGGDAYALRVPVPQYAESGTWTIMYLRLVDCLGNSRTLNPADLAAAGYGTEFPRSSSASDIRRQPIDMECAGERRCGIGLDHKHLQYGVLGGYERCSLADRDADHGAG